MYIDSLLKLSDAQALTATALSTNVAPMDNSMGIGEPLAVVITVGVAADFTTGDETYSFAVETDSVAAMSSATILSTKAVLTTALGVGDKVVMPIDHTDLEGFIAVRYTLAGTTPTITVDAQVMPMKMVDGYVNYADGFTIA